MDKVLATQLVNLVDMIVYGKGETYDSLGHNEWTHVMNFCFHNGLIVSDIDCDGPYLTVTEFYDEISNIAYPYDDSNDIEYPF